MYSIITVTDGIERTIYDPFIGSFLVQSPKLTEELNQPGSLEFTLLYGHDAFGHLEALKTYVTAYKDDEEIFYGRVLSVEPNVLLGQEEIVCEGAMSFLNDGHLPPDPKNSSGTQVHQTQTAEEFFNRVINAYNADVDDYRRMFTVGEVSHSRKSDTRQYQISNYMSAKEAIENQLLNQYGGFIRIRNADESGAEANSVRIQKNYFQLGNVKLLERPSVSSSTMQAAGWDDVEEGQTSTVYSLWYSAGTDGIPWSENVIIHVTPILSNGTVLTPAQMDSYVDTLIANSSNASGILSADKTRNNLVLWVQSGITNWGTAQAKADLYDELLHSLQAVYYLGDDEALPTQAELQEFNPNIRIISSSEMYLIDWIESYDRTNEAVVELGENVITQTNRMSGEDMFTAIRPVGKDGLIHSTTPVIDIYSEEDMLAYGRIIKNVDFPNITTEAALLAAGSELADRINKTLYISSEISLLDLHVLDEEEPDIRVGDEFTNIAGLDDVSLIVSSRTSDFENPQNDSISLKNAKSLEGNGLDDFRNDGNSLSKRSAKNSGGVGMALKYYSEAVTELGSQVKIVADRITLAADKLLQIHADEFIQTGANLETLSTTVLNTSSMVQHIEGTGVIQNSEAITTLAGQFEVTRDPSDSIWRVKLIEGAQLQVQKDGIYSDVVNQEGMSSAIAQTASNIRAEVNSAKSELSTSIEQTADSIRSEANAASSAIYSSITQTASNIRAEVASVDSALSTSIEQTADSIRSEVNAANSAVYSSITQTASNIRSEVANVNSNLRSVINQTASNIMLEVSKSAKVFHQYSDPASTETVKDKDLWIKDAGVNSHGKAANFTYGQLGDFKLADFYGSEIYVRKNGAWERIGGDQLSKYTHARLDVDEDRISMITDSMSGDYAEFIVELGRIHSRVEDVENGLTSTIEQTASMIRSAVWTANSEMYSEILQTQSMIRTEVGDAESNLRSEFTQTAAGLNVKIGNKSRVFKWNKDPIRHSDARALLAQMWNEGELSYGDLWVYDPNLRTHGEAAQNTYGNLASNTYADFYGCKVYQVLGADNVRKIGDNQLDEYVSADIAITKEHFKYTTGSLAGRCASLEVSRDQIKTSVVDLRRDLGSSITQTASEIRSAVWAANSQIYSSISQTASAIRLEVTNKIESVSSSITQTASEIRSEVNTANSRIYSAITQTASAIRLEVTNKISSVSSSITQTAESIRSEVNTANSRIYSAIQQTASQIRLEVTNKVSSLQSQITQEANKIALVVKSGGIDAASIVTAINARTGTGYIKLKASQIELDGETIASYLTGQAIGASFLGGTDLQVDERIILLSGTTIGLQSSVASYPAKNIVVSASSSGNVLTLYHLDGSTTTFSKATTLDVSSWSGSVLTMAAKQNGSTVASKTLGFGGLVTSHDIELQLANNGTPTKVANLSNVISCPVKVEQLTAGNPTLRYTRDIQFNVSSLLGTITIYNNGTYTPDSSIGFSSVTVDVSGGGGTIDIPSNQIYTSDRSTGQKLNVLRNKYEEARSDGDFVMFRVDCGGSSKWYYMEP